jgi:dTDP-glucose 4,6-dehydratase/UDP-glucuronate decarboxylase
MSSSISPALTLEDLLEEDLGYICRSLEVEFAELAGKRLLITGGAGFLGYYLVQGALHFNRDTRRPIDVTLYDNFVRGYPDWLVKLEGSRNLALVKHDITNPCRRPNRSTT